MRPKNAIDGPTIENSFVTTVVTPSKCTGRAAPQRPSVRPADVHHGARRAVRVHLLDRRHEQDVDAGLLRDRGVAVEIARVRGEVLVRTELRRVDEQRHDDEVRRVAGRARISER